MSQASTTKQTPSPRAERSRTMAKKLLRAANDKRLSSENRKESARLASNLMKLAEAEKKGRLGSKQSKASAKD